MLTNKLKDLEKVLKTFSIVKGSVIKFNCVNVNILYVYGAKNTWIVWYFIFDILFNHYHIYTFERCVRLTRELQQDTLQSIVYGVF